MTPLFLTIAALSLVTIGGVSAKEVSADSKVQEAEASLADPQLCMLPSWLTERGSSLAGVGERNPLNNLGDSVYSGDMELSSTDPDLHRPDYGDVHVPNSEGHTVSQSPPHSGRNGEVRSCPTLGDVALNFVSLIGGTQREETLAVSSPDEVQQLVDKELRAVFASVASPIIDVTGRKRSHPQLIKEGARHAALIEATKFSEKDIRDKKEAIELITKQAIQTYVNAYEHTYPEAYQRASAGTMAVGTTYAQRAAQRYQIRQMAHLLADKAALRAVQRPSDNEVYFSKESIEGASDVANTTVSIPKSASFRAGTEVRQAFGEIFFQAIKKETMPQESSTSGFRQQAFRTDIDRCAQFQLIGEDGGIEDIHVTEPSDSSRHPEALNVSVKRLESFLKSNADVCVSDDFIDITGSASSQKAFIGGEEVYLILDAGVVWPYAAQEKPTLIYRLQKIPAIDGFILRAQLNKVGPITSFIKKKIGDETTPMTKANLTSRCDIISVEESTMMKSQQDIIIKITQNHSFSRNNPITAENFPAQFEVLDLEYKYKID